MPMIRIQTNQTVTDSKVLLEKLSSSASLYTGKPEAYIMTAITDGLAMIFAGTDEAAAFIECKSIGLEESQTKALSAWLCDFCEKELSIPKNRVYIEFASARGSMWGWQGGTF
mgnify:CR=1 FL=1